MSAGGTVSSVLIVLFTALPNASNVFGLHALQTMMINPHMLMNASWVTN